MDNIRLSYFILELLFMGCFIFGIVYGTKYFLRGKRRHE